MAAFLDSSLAGGIESADLWLPTLENGLLVTKVPTRDLLQLTEENSRLVQDNVHLMQLNAQLMQAYAHLHSLLATTQMSRTKMQT